MILKPDDLRKCRPIAENINDNARLVPYISEAETLRLQDVLGASLYSFLDPQEDNDNYTFEPDHGDPVTITEEELKIIYWGGYWKDNCGNGQYCPGLKPATAYLAYARFLMNNPLNPTAFGVVYKNGEFSTGADTKETARAASEAEKIGEAYLMKCVLYLKYLGLMPCGVAPLSPRRDLAIRRCKL